MATSFVPLHLHTQYSLLDGAIQISKLIKRAKEFNIPAVAITDHGNMFGVIEFYKEAKELGIKPIIGCEIYLAKDRFYKVKSDLNKAFHLILLAKNEEGYKNLIQIVSKAYTEGFYSKPRADKNLLKEYSSGLIALSACFKGEIPYLLMNGQEKEALEVLEEYLEIFGKDNFYLEIQNNGLKEQNIVNQKLIELSKKTGVDLVATNDCHYLMPDDWSAHDILLCLQTRTKITDTNRLKFETKELYFKSPKEMYSYFASNVEAVKNTLKIAEMCNLNLDLNTFKLPKYNLLSGLTDAEHITVLAKEGLNRRLQDNNIKQKQQYIERLNKELKMIIQMGFASYFLIVQDFIRYAKSKNIPVGPGRGSVAGSLVAYALGITDIDPIKYNLLFERFLNPDRISMPDIDVDFCHEKRQEVIDYVKEKYGADYVTHVITFGSMAARAVIRDVGRVLDVPLKVVDEVAKLVPSTQKTIEKALEEVPKLKELYNKNEQIKQIIDYGKKLEGLKRHASTHAAGIVIAPQPITNFMPLYLNTTESNIATTQFNMESIEKIGLVKFDFLGLKTLTIIDKTIGYIKQTEGKEIDIANIPVNDELTYKLLQRGETVGVFQLESVGMQNLLKKIKPENIEDLIALIALYRPGPLGSGMVENFIKRKRGKEKIEYKWKDMQNVLHNILKDTYGIVVYQEQVMQIANKIAGFTLAQADILRKAMGKKKQEEMIKQKNLFVNGAIKNGYSQQSAEELFDQLTKFAEYGFNKSHSVAYAHLALQTAYLKAHYPIEFISSNICVDGYTEDKIIPLINECKRLKITITPPDVKNGKTRDIEIDKKNKIIRLGIGMIKGIGKATIDEIVTQREKEPFNSIFDFIIKTKINQKSAQALIYAGALDSFLPDLPPNIARAYLTDIFTDTSIKEIKKSKKNFKKLSLFVPEEKNIEPIDNNELLNKELELYGFYLSGHPIDKYKEVLVSSYCVSEIGAIKDDEFKDNNNNKDNPYVLHVAGIISDIKVKYNKNKDQQYAYVTLNDGTGVIEILIPPDLYEKHKNLLTKNNLITISFETYKKDEILFRKAKNIYEVEELYKYNRLKSKENKEKENEQQSTVSTIINTETKIIDNNKINTDLKDNKQQIQQIEEKEKIIAEYKCSCESISCNIEKHYIPILFCKKCNEFMKILNDKIDNEIPGLLDAFSEIVKKLDDKHKIYLLCICYGEGEDIIVRIQVQHDSYDFIIYPFLNNNKTYANKKNTSNTNQYIKELKNFFETQLKHYKGKTVNFKIIKSPLKLRDIKIENITNIDIKDKKEKYQITEDNPCIPMGI